MSCFWRMREALARGAWWAIGDAARFAPPLAVTWFARQKSFRVDVNPLPNADYARGGRNRFCRR